MQVQGFRFRILKSRVLSLCVRGFAYWGIIQVYSCVD